MSWFQYLLEVNLYLILLYGFYVLVLKNNTFFKLNRIYLLSSGIMALLLPVVQFESIRALFITEQVRQTTRSISTVMTAPEVSSVQAATWTAADLFLAVYITGLIFFVSRFLFQLYAVYRSRTDASTSLKAYSFFGKIVVSDEIEGRKVIMEHENIHARQWHSADVLFFELIAIVNWFNPVVYAFKKALKYVHEFIADEAVSENQFTKEEYSLLLLSNVFGIRSRELSNSFFNQSLLKRRIIMLHKRKSKKITLLNYTLCIPLFAAMLIFSSSTLRIEDYSEPIKNMKLSSFINTDSQSDAYYNLFLKRNPQVKSLIWTSQPTVTVVLKNGSKEVYDLKKDGQMEKAGVKYGTLPTAASIPLSEIPASQIEKLVYNGDSNPFQDPVYPMTTVEVLPAFPGGKQAWAEFLQGYNYPAMARESNISGKIIISFIVEKNGSLTDIQILRDLGGGTGEEALRLLKTSPKWIPGKIAGKAVRVDYTQPIALTLN